MALSLYQSHVAKWRDCTACDLHRTRGRVVLAKGKIPCDVLFVGEAPGFCISGDTLIDTAWRDKSIHPDGIPIKDLVGKTGIQVYSFDLNEKKLAIGNVKKVWKVGLKKVYRISFYWWGAPPDGKGGRQKYYGDIKVTDNHPFLLKKGTYLSLKEGLKVGDRLQPFYRNGVVRNTVGVYSGDMVLEYRFLMQNHLGRELSPDEHFHHRDRNKLNDTFENLEPTDVVEHARMHGYEDNPMSNSIHRDTHRAVMESSSYREKMSKRMKEVLADPEARAKRIAQIHSQRKQTSETLKRKFATDPLYYYNYLTGRKLRNGQRLSQEVIKEKFSARFPDAIFPPEDNHEIYKIEPVGFETVYDMEVEKYHNFVTNGIVVHNSEDTVGIPFIGPAGRLLDEIVALSGIGQFRFAFTNMIACIPKGEDGDKVAEPPDESIEACSARLKEFVAIARPRLIVQVGKVAQDWTTPGYKHSIQFHETIPMVFISHPAAILRAREDQKGYQKQRAVIALRDAIDLL